MSHSAVPWGLTQNKVTAIPTQNTEVIWYRSLLPLLWHSKLIVKIVHPGARTQPYGFGIIKMHDLIVFISRNPLGT